MMVGLRRHPKVVQIVSALKADRLRVVGGLYAVWGVFDEHSVDGRLPGYSFEMMDEEIGWPGFSAAMHGVGWLDRDADCGLVMPRFQTHNGTSAKRRAEDTERKRRERGACPENVRDSADSVLSPSLGSKDQEEKETRARKIAIPDDFAIRPEDREWAKKNGFGQYLDLHYAYFVDWANGDRAKRRYTDWHASFRNCVRADWGDVRKSAQRASGGPTPSVVTPLRSCVGCETSQVVGSVGGKWHCAKQACKDQAMYGKAVV